MFDAGIATDASMKLLSMSIGSNASGGNPSGYSYHKSDAAIVAATVKLSDYQRAEALKRRADGESLTSIAKSYGVAISMISRLELPPPKGANPYTPG
jgi:hypothetical protein